jgi:hypothetical protein
MKQPPGKSDFDVKTAVSLDYRLAYAERLYLIEQHSFRCRPLNPQAGTQPFQRIDAVANNLGDDRLVDRQIIDAASLAQRAFTVRKFEDFGK